MALISLALFGCAPTAAHQPMADADLSFLALGDSYTIGEGVPPGGGWPAQLATMLRQRGVGIADPIVIARTGWTTDELDAAIDAAAPEGPFDLVTLLIGVNNQYRGRSVDDYRGEFRALLERAIGFAGGRADRVVVLSIPDWGVTPFAEGRDRGKIADQIDLFNAANREITDELGAAYVDVTPISRERGAESGMLVADGLHPSAAMYAEWARLALGAVVEVVEP
jgi:lysophospholipase L1-like esterase